MAIVFASSLDMPSLAIGAILGALFSWIFTRLNDELNQRRATARGAIRDCGELRVLLGKRFDAVRNAVEPAPSPEDTLRKLGEFIQENNYENRLSAVLAKLRTEPLCEPLCRKAVVWKVTALDNKG